MVSVLIFDSSGVNGTVPYLKESRRCSGHTSDADPVCGKQIKIRSQSGLLK